MGAHKGRQSRVWVLYGYNLGRVCGALICVVRHGHTPGLVLARGAVTADERRESLCLRVCLWDACGKRGQHVRGQATVYVAFVLCDAHACDAQSLLDVSMHRTYSTCRATGL